MAIQPEEIMNSDQLKNDDIIIVLMGPTGAGKSHMVDTISGQLGERSGSTLDSCTSEVNALRIKNHEKYKDRIVLLDTPGFDDSDTDNPDLKILEIIAKYLVEMYKKKINLTGILYLHRITDNRMFGSIRRNIRLFNQLCGEKAAGHVEVVTTMWDKVEVKEGEGRELTLRSFWATEIGNGLTLARFDNTSQSAWKIIDNMAIKKSGDLALLLQEEMVDHNQKVEETQAGRQALSSPPQARPQEIPYARKDTALDKRDKSEKALLADAIARIWRSFHNPSVRNGDHPKDPKEDKTSRNPSRPGDHRDATQTKSIESASPKYGVHDTTKGTSNVQISEVHFEKDSPSRSASTSIQPNFAPDGSETFGGLHTLLDDGSNTKIRTPQATSRLAASACSLSGTGAQGRTVDQGKAAIKTMTTNVQKKNKKQPPLPSAPDTCIQGFSRLYSSKCGTGFCLQDNDSNFTFISTSQLEAIMRCAIDLEGAMNDPDRIQLQVKPLGYQTVAQILNEDSMQRGKLPTASHGGWVGGNMKDYPLGTNLQHLLRKKSTDN